MSELEESLFGTEPNTDATVANAIIPFLSALTVVGTDKKLLRVRGVTFLEQDGIHLVNIDAKHQDVEDAYRTDAKTYLSELMKANANKQCTSTLYNGELQRYTREQARVVLMKGSSKRKAFTALAAIRAAYGDIPVPSFGLTNKMLVGRVREGGYVPQVGELVDVSFVLNDNDTLVVTSMLRDARVATMPTRRKEDFGFAEQPVGTEGAASNDAAIDALKDQIAELEGAEMLTASDKTKLTKLRGKLAKLAVKEEA